MLCAWCSAARLPSLYMCVAAVLQGNVFTFLQQSGGRLPESVVVPMILEPTMSALNYIHGLVSAGCCCQPTMRSCGTATLTSFRNSAVFVSCAGASPPTVCILCWSFPAYCCLVLSQDCVDVA